MQWQPVDYIHRIVRTRRGGATGVAITHPTSADADQLAAIEKLLGRSIPPMDAATGAPAAEEKPKARARKPKGESAELESRPAEEQKPRSERPKPKSKPDADRKPKAERPEPKSRPAEARKPRREPEPAAAELEFAEDDWNGPVPSFLGQGLG